MHTIWKCTAGPPKLVSPRCQLRMSISSIAVMVLENPARILESRFCSSRAADRTDEIIFNESDEVNCTMEKYSKRVSLRVVSLELSSPRASQIFFFTMFGDEHVLVPPFDWSRCIR